MAAASPSRIGAQTLFDAPYRWFPSSAPVHAVAAWPRWHRTGAFAVTTHTDPMSIEVFTAQPDGDLGSSAIIPVPSHPHGVAIADFDGDDCPDIAAGGYDPPGIVLIHGRCAGRFDSPAFIPTATPVEGLAVADIDADGFPDLVGWSTEGGVVLLGDRAGSFQEPVPLPGSYPERIAVGRIDPDPYPDVGAMISRNGLDSLAIRYGRGDGTFGDQRTFGAGYGAGAPGLADLDGDGRLDVVYGIDAGTPYDGDVGVLVNDGNGNLGPASGCPSPYINVSAAPSVFTGGDVDGDGLQDAIAIAASRGGPVMTLLLGNGCGGFGAWSFRDVQSFGQGVFADLDGDGRDDFLQPDGDGVSLFTGSASGRFGPQWLGLGSYTGDVIPAHVDDGPTLDLVVEDGDHDTFYFELGTGDGGFQQGIGGEPFPNSIAIADLDLDGHNDIVTSSMPYGSTAIWLGDGTGTVTHRQDLSVWGVVGVLRAGGDPDPEVLVLKPDSLIVFRNRGDTVFEPSRAWSGGGDRLVVCDLNADGRDDAIIGNGNTNLSVRLGGPDGLGAALTVTVTLGGEIQAADLDGDGRLDVFAGNDKAAPSWLRGRGDGTFDAPVPLALPPASSYAFADWNGDGMLDAAFLKGKVGVVFGTGGASFSAPTWFGTGQRPTKLLAGDFNDDGRPDLALQGSHELPNGDQSGKLDFLNNSIPAGTLLGVGGGPVSHSPVLALGVPRPNPLRNGTRLQLSPGAAARVDVRVLDIAGREVRVLFHGAARPGEQDVTWDGRDARGRSVPPGVYLVCARDEHASITRRVVVLR